MRPKDLVRHLRKAYLKARQLCYPPAHQSNAFYRGTSHSVSSVFEDLLARYCYDRIKRIRGIRIIVDPQISFPKSRLRNPSGKRPKLVRPDICIFKDDKAVIFFYLNLDIGQQRNDFYKQARKARILEQKIAGKLAKTKNFHFSISKNIQFIHVIASEANAKREILGKTKKAFKKYGIPLCILISGVGPNDRISDKEFYNKLKINTSTFKYIDSKIKASLK